MSKKIIFANLSYKTTEQTLISYFSTFGKINKFDLYKDDQEQSLRTGYVEFFDMNSINNLMIKRPHYLDEREISLRREIPKYFCYGGVAEHLGNDLMVNELFISRLCSGETKEMFVKYFQQFGTIIDCRVVNSSSYNPKQMGYAFVRFADYDSVDQIILSRPHIIHSYFYPVRKCIPREYNYILSSIKPLGQSKSMWRHYDVGLINTRTQLIIYPTRQTRKPRSLPPACVPMIVRYDKPPSPLPPPESFPASDFIDIANLSLFDTDALKVSTSSSMKKSPSNEFEIILNNSLSSSTISIINSTEDFTPLHSPLYSTAIAQTPSPPDVVPMCDKIEQKSIHSSMNNITDDDEKKSCDLM